MIQNLTPWVEKHLKKTPPNHGGREAVATVLQAFLLVPGNQNIKRERCSRYLSLGKLYLSRLLTIQLYRARSPRPFSTSFLALAAFFSASLAAFSASLAAWSAAFLASLAA